MVKSAYLAGLLAACTPAAAQLHNLAVSAGLKYFGSCLDNGHRSDAGYMNIINNKAEVGQLVPENGQKWAYVEPSRGTFTYNDADVVPNIAAANGQVLRCHTLTWHSQLPSWGKSWKPHNVHKCFGELTIPF
jgi:endo-1,4-beta-xylanase